MKKFLINTAMLICICVHLDAMAEGIWDEHCAVLCGKATKVTGQRDVQTAVRRLQDAFRKNVGSGTVTKCSIVFQEFFGQGFSGVGGACQVTFNKTKSNWLICTSDGVANFVATIGVISFPENRAADRTEVQVVEMIQSNCVGG